MHFAAPPASWKRATREPPPWASLALVPPQIAKQIAGLSVVAICTLVAFHASTVFIVLVAIVGVAGAVMFAAGIVRPR